MKIRELIKELEKFPNQEAEVLIQHWLLAKESDKVIVSLTKAIGIFKKADGSNDAIMIDTEKFEANI